MNFYFNITFNIENQIFNEWWQWQEHFLLKEIFSKNNFSSYKIIRVFVEDAEWKTYCIQLETNDLNIIKRFKQEQEAQLKHQLFIHFKETVMWFSTELHLIQTIENQSFYETK